jgi:hypothetical protein
MTCGRLILLNDAQHYENTVCSCYFFGMGLPKFYVILVLTD